MKRHIAIFLSVALLSACQEEQAALPDPIAITAETAGHFCQMTLLEHDGPKGQIHLAGMPHPIFFGQAIEVLTYIHMPEQSHEIAAAYVQDMGGDATWAEPGDWIRADRAVYVVGSDRMGGMGAPEFIPFSDPVMARDFAARHGGELRAFDEIAAKDVIAPADHDAHEATDDIASRLGALTRGKEF